MGLVSVTGLWRSQLLASRILCGHRGLPQRDFFSDNEVNLLVSAVNAAGSMRDQPTCEPWASVLPDRYEATLVDLRKAYDVVVVRRKEARDTSESMVRGAQCRGRLKLGEPSCRGWSADLQCC